MGSCFSTYSEPLNKLTAKVITLKGAVREYTLDVTVSQILESETTPSCFLCNSDQLYYDEFIQPLSTKEELQAGQIYFVLPANRLQYRLTAQDMAAMAVKASLAIGGESSKKKGKGSVRRRMKPVRVSPDSEVNQRLNEERFGNGMKRFDQSSKVLGITRSGSVRKLQRNASKRTKMAIRSFRLRLTTIYEGSTAEHI